MRELNGPQERPLDLVDPVAARAQSLLLFGYPVCSDLSVAFTSIWLSLLTTIGESTEYVRPLSRRANPILGESARVWSAINEANAR